MPRDFFDELPVLPGEGIRIGTAGWTDPTLIKSGRFYPSGVSSAAERLSYYAEHFNLVEVDSSFYFLPSFRNSVLWVERTPEGFLFNVKAFSAMTQHPMSLHALPVELRKDLAPGDENKDAKLAAAKLPREIVDVIWSEFIQALAPLHESGKLGSVLFQFPKWFPYSHANMDYILKCKQRLGDYRMAVEFRQGTWMEPRNQKATLDFLRKNGLIYVCVDEPQGLPNSVPLVPEATSNVGIFRLHGRNQATWNKQGAGVAERFHYLYSPKELKGLVPVVKEIASSAQETQIVFNNCYQDYAVRNASELGAMLA